MLQRQRGTGTSLGAVMITADQYYLLGPQQRSPELWALLDVLFGIPQGGVVSIEQAAAAAERVGISARTLRRQLSKTRPEPSRRGRRRTPWASVLEARESRAALRRAVAPARVSGLTTEEREGLERELAALGLAVNRALLALDGMSA
jgi:hypothetical protein